jgi:hypothetical protein
MGVTSGVRNHLSERPAGRSAQMVPGPFPGPQPLYNLHKKLQAILDPDNADRCADSSPGRNRSSGRSPGEKRQQPNPAIYRWKDATISPSFRWNESKKPCQRPSSRTSPQPHRLYEMHGWLPRQPRNLTDPREDPSPPFPHLPPIRIGREILAE